jgi:molybdate transport system permease protein
VTVAAPAVLRDRSTLGLGAIAWLGGLLLGLPVAVLVGRAAIGAVVPSGAGLGTVATALGLSFATTAVSLLVTALVGLPLAIVLAGRARGRGSVVLETLVDLPIVLPPSVAGLALLLVLGRSGLLGPALGAFGVEIPFTTAAVVLAQVFVSAPFFIRSARVGIAAVPADLQDAARADGASEAGVLRSITLPLAAPALAAGLVMSWARALGEFGATIMFAGNVAGRTQTLPLVVYGEFQAGDLDAAVAAAAVLVVAAFGVLVAVRALHWQRALDVRAIG